VGALLGAGIASLVTQIPAVGSFLVPRYTVSVFLQGFMVAVVVGLIGAAYPAWRATRLTPMEALRYE
jgi:putative ABC transport system permease protein